VLFDQSLRSRALSRTEEASGERGEIYHTKSHTIFDFAISSPWREVRIRRVVRGLYEKANGESNLGLCRAA
jgi:hypothetical protein